MKPILKDGDILDYSTNQQPQILINQAYKLNPYSTVLVTFKDKRQFIAKLDPQKPVMILDEEIPSNLIIGQPDSLWWQITDGRMQDKIIQIQDISKTDYLTVNELGQGDATEAVFNDDVAQTLNQNENFQQRTAFSQQKVAKKYREKHSNLCKIQLMTPYLLCLYYYQQNINRQQADPWLLSPMSLCYSVQNMNITRIQKSRILVYDDYQGIPSSAVASRLGIVQNRIQQNTYDNALKLNQLALQVLNSQKVFSTAADQHAANDVQSNNQLQNVIDLQQQIIKCLHTLYLESGIESFDEFSIVQTGQVSGQQLKMALLDCNAIPLAQSQSNVDQLNGNLQANICPPIFPVTTSRFFNQDDNFEDYCYGGEVQQLRKQLPRIFPHQLHDHLCYEFQMWFERRMATAGLDLSNLVKVLYLMNNQNMNKRDYQSYLNATVIEAVKNCQLWDDKFKIAAQQGTDEAELDETETKQEARVQDQLEKVKDQNKEQTKAQLDEKQQQLPQQANIQPEQELKNQAQEKGDVEPVLFAFNQALLCAKSRPLIVYMQLAQYIESGASVVVFHQFQPPLVELCDFLIQYKMGTRMGISEVHEIPQQVLPGRSHPEMTGQVANGFVLKFFAQGKEAVAGGKVGHMGKRKGGKIRQ